jgi:cytochrome c-type biogenesis protein CcmF
MIAELGYYALALALIQSSSAIGARKGDVALMKLADSTTLGRAAVQ